MKDVADAGCTEREDAIWSNQAAQCSPVPSPASVMVSGAIDTARATLSPNVSTSAAPATAGTQANSSERRSLTTDALTGPTGVPGGTYSIKVSWRTPAVRSVTVDVGTPAKWALAAWLRSRTRFIELSPAPRSLTLTTTCRPLHLSLSNVPIGTTY